MSKSHNQSRGSTLPFQTSDPLWHMAGAHTLALGCQQCFYQSMCGGLEIGAEIFDCMDFCRCREPSACDNVCPRHPERLVARVREIGGLEFENILPAPVVETPRASAVVPLIYHGTARLRPLECPWVALPLRALVDYATGRARFATREALANHFRIDPSCQLMASGTDDDPAIEHWWKLADRESVIQTLRALGIALMTTPNYSLFSEVPRLDNLYNMKRIALVWSEIQRGGLACALHLNARTDKDWNRWSEFLLDHSEIQAVAFEFGTGAGFSRRIDWHAQQLCRLAERLDRPMDLLVRGGIQVVERLRGSFAHVSLIDTRPFLKAQRRQRGFVVNGRLRWGKCPTAPGEPIDDLLEANIAAVSASTLLPWERLLPASSLFSVVETLEAANDARDESPQFELLNEPPRR